MPFGPHAIGVEMPLPEPATPSWAGTTKEAAAASGAARPATARADGLAREAATLSHAIKAAAIDVARASPNAAPELAAIADRLRAAEETAATSASAPVSIASDGGVALADFALESAGASVVACSDTFVAPARGKPDGGADGLRTLARAGGPGAAAALVNALRRVPRALAFWSRALVGGKGGGAGGWDVNRPARNALRPGVAPGECWAAAGSSARLLVRLAARVVPSAFSLDFPPLQLRMDGDARSAPRKLLVWGVEPAAGATAPLRALPPLQPNSGGARRVLLGRYEFKPSHVGVATFPAQPGGGGGGLFGGGGRRGATGAAFEYIELEIASNHGHPDYTALYRFRVHGESPRA
jgi:hypothetical protein